MNTKKLKNRDKVRIMHIGNFVLSISEWPEEPINEQVLVSVFGADKKYHVLSKMSYKTARSFFGINLRKAPIN